MMQAFNIHDITQDFGRKIPFSRRISRLVSEWKKFKKFKEDFSRFKEMNDRTFARFSVDWKDRYPCLHDDAPTHLFDTHYIYHTGWAARILARTRPSLHVDVSSSLYFLSIVSAFIPIQFLGYRPTDITLDNITTQIADIRLLPFEDQIIKSLSCMHTVEHVGLGRYGDPMEPDGDLRAITELKRVLAPGGNLLFVVPVGSPKIMFNAHRIYSYQQIMGYFSDLELREFSLVPDNGGPDGLISNASEEMSNGCKYGCGCFWFQRRDA
jgi:SAM-dependent methyltransferase